MDWIRTLNQCNIRHNLKIINSFKKTLLNNNPDVFSLQRVDAYNITHTIFYLTDFGFSNKIEVDTRKMSQIKWILNTLLYIYTIDQDWDVIAELLVCCDCLYWHPPFYQTAWEQLIAAQI